MAPKLITIWLPPSHPFMAMSDEEFESHAGPHVRRVASEPIPIEGKEPIYARVFR